MQSAVVWLLAPKIGKVDLGSSAGDSSDVNWTEVYNVSWDV